MIWFDQWNIVVDLIGSVYEDLLSSNKTIQSNIHEHLQFRRELKGILSCSHQLPCDILPFTNFPGAALLSTVLIWFNKVSVAENSQLLSCSIRPSNVGLSGMNENAGRFRFRTRPTNERLSGGCIKAWRCGWLHEIDRWPHRRVWKYFVGWDGRSREWRWVGVRWRW